MTTDAHASWWDKDLENVVAGQALLGAGAFEAYTAAGLEPEHFQQFSCRAVWQAATALSQVGQPVEMVGVHRELHRIGLRHELVRRDGERVQDLLTRLVDGLPWPRDVDARRAYVRANATRLHELWALRQTAAQMHIALNAQDPDAEMLRAQLAEATERLAQPLLADDGGADSALAAALVSASKDQSGALLGLDAIDETFGGIKSGEVCVLEARSSVGKTIVLCRSAFHTLREAGWGVVFFSMEMTKAAIFERFYRIATGLDKWQYQAALKGGELDQDRWLATYPGLVLHDQQHSLADIERKVQRAKADQLAGAPGVLVILDYFGLLMGDERLSSYERASKHARDLKKLAKRRDVAVLPAVQVGREAGGDGDQIGRAHV